MTTSVSVSCSSRRKLPAVAGAETHEWTTWLLMVAVLVAIYSPAVMARYGFSDDFYQFFGAADGGAPIPLGGGRLVLASLLRVLAGRIQTIGSLGFLRLFSLMGLIGLSTVFYVILRRLSPRPLPRAAFCVGLATLPTLLEFTAWASCCLFPATACLSSVAAILAWRAFIPTEIQWTRRAALLGGAFVLMEISEATYQPCMMWFWTTLLVYVLDEQALRSPAYRRQLGQTILAGLVYLAVGFLLLKLSVALSDIPPDRRVQLVQSPAAKVYSLVREQMPLALNLWHLAEPARKGLIVLVAATTALVVFFGYLARCSRYLRQAAIRTTGLGGWNVAGWTGMLLFVLACSHTHWLVIDENPMNYRLVGSLAGAILVIAFWAALELAHLITLESRRRTIETLGAAALITSTSLLGVYHLHRYWITPYTTGYRYVLHCLRQPSHELIRHVHVIRQSAYEGLVPEWIVYDFGRPLTNPPWAPPGLVKAALAELGDCAPPVERITHGTADESIPAGDGILVIDMRKLAEFR